MEKNNKMKIFLLWNIFQKTILNLSKLTSKLSQFCTFCDFGRTSPPPVFLDIRKISKKRKNPSEWKVLKLFSGHFDKKKLSQFVYFVDFRHKMGYFHFHKIAIFWKFEKFGWDLRIQFWFFEKNFSDKSFLL